MRRLLQLFTGSLLIFAGVVFSTQTAKAYDPLGQVCQNNPDATACTENSQGQGGENPISSTVQSAVNLLSIAIGFAAVLVIIVAGITMTLSQGDSGKIKSSRDAIIYAAVGLVVAALARTIVFFIVGRTSQ